MRTRPRAAAALLALAALAVAGCGGAGQAPTATTAPSTTVATATAPPTATTPPTASTPFDYDRSAPLAFRDRGTVAGSGAVVVQDVSYAIPGRRVQGYLVLPPGKARVPAVIYLGGAGADRKELLSQAVWLASRGAVALTITPPSTAAGATPAGLDARQMLAREQRLAVADVVAARRGVDLLQEQERVDARRVGLVGLSYGARTGAVLAGVEPRLDALALESCGAEPVSLYVSQAPPELRAQVRRMVTALDPLRWIRRARPGTILLQNGRKDTVVPREALDRVVRTAPRGTAVRWYPADHLLDQAAIRDQVDWLVKKLRIGTAPAPS